MFVPERVGDSAGVQDGVAGQDGRHGSRFSSREGRRDGNDNVQTLEQCVLHTRACWNTLHRCPPLILFFLI